MNSRKIVTIDPSRSSHPVSIQIRQVPVPLTPLVGREHEMQTVCTLLLRPEVRLLTLTGTGGVGKTRLALQIAAVLQEDFADGVCFISLASIRNPDLVVPIIAHTLGLIETGERVLFERLKTFLQDKHLLLLLDNFEQVLTAAPVLANLLSACPGVKLLVTSRAVLHVQGEYEYSVPLLALPDLHCLPDWETISQYAAVRLFVQRAQAIKTGFQVTESNARAIAEICARLDGLPLALELAATRIKLLSPQTLLARLEHRLEVLTRGGLDLPARQQTLHNTITWGYDLLTGEEQRCFRRLSIFDGGCTLEAAERVCNAPGDLATPILDLVASLLDKSLLQQVEQGGDESRLLLLETTREYGLKRLLEAGELERLQEVHAGYYLAFIEEATPALYGMHERTCLERLDRERNNLLAALHFLFERNAPEALGDEVAALALLEEALSLGRVQDNQDYIAQALCGMGRLALRKGDPARARTLFEESIMVLKELWTSSSPAVKWTLASSLEGLGEIALSQEQAAWTVQLFAAANVVRTVNGYSMRIGKEQPSYKRILTSARAQLDRKTFDALWEKGQRMCPQQALSARHSGEAIVPTSLPTSTIAPAPAPSSGLTRRELEVLGLLANGLTNKQIADQLVVSEHTVNVHVQSIYSKLGVTSRVAATRYAISHGLL